MFNMTVGSRGLELCKQFEGRETDLGDGYCLAYLDTIGTGTPWTIGYGSTGAGIRQGTKWTYAQCDKALLSEMNEKARGLNAYLTVRVNQNQFDALACAAYNLGVMGMHTVLDAINDGDNDRAMSLLLQHNHAQGVVVSGLTRRRYAEKELFEWETADEVKKLSPSIQTADNVQNTAVAGGLSVGALWSYLPQAQEMLKDHVGSILLCTVLAVCGVTFLWKRHVQTSFDNGTYVPVGTKPVVEAPSDANA